MDTGKAKQPLLQVQGLRVWFPRRTSFFGNVKNWVKAVDDVSFTLMPGKTLGLVGESGSGKTTTGLAVMRARGVPLRAGSVRFSPDGQTAHELAHLTPPQMRPLRRHMQMIFQDPFSSLNPRMTVLRLIAEPLLVNGMGDAKQRREKVKSLLNEVGLSPAFINRYPHAFSGGQRQRLVVARALALNPSLIVCDEPLSALDVSVQAQTLNLMIELRERHKLAYLFISHDLHVVRHISDEVAVMYAGRLVEHGPKEKVYTSPLHPYTQELLASAPRPDPRRRKERHTLSGEVPDPSNLPAGCVFHPRCPKAREECSRLVPATTRIDDRDVRCLHYEDLDARKEEGRAREREQAPVPA